MSLYSVKQLETESDALIDRALKGEEVVITRGGKPLVELRIIDRALHSTAPTLAESLEAMRRARERLAALSEYVGPGPAELIRQLRDEGVG